MAGLARRGGRSSGQRWQGKALHLGGAHNWGRGRDARSPSATLSPATKEDFTLPSRLQNLLVCLTQSALSPQSNTKNITSRASRTWREIYSGVLQLLPFLPFSLRAQAPRLARRRRASRAALSPRTKKIFPSLTPITPRKRTNPLKTLDETRFSPSLDRPEKISHTPLRVRERFGNIRGGRRNRRGVYPGIRNV